jgi:hypothetical protein
LTSIPSQGALAEDWKNETSLLFGLQNGCEGAMCRCAQYGLLTLVEIEDEMKG